MNQTDWKKLQDVYAAGLLLDEEERERLLEKSCNSGEAIAKEVSALWESSANDDLDFEALPELAMRAFLESGIGIDDGRGGQAYEILETIAIGGMATVYKARQLRPIQRTVALKVVPGERGSEENIKRFRAEQRALSLMAHRNIAVVYDAGMTTEARPFFSMEYLSAEPITTYCDTHCLTIRQRLALLLDVCEGIQHAHQKGVIHRDIHPGNILVDVREGRPVPKIIDFGIAKLTDASKLAEPVKTRYGTVMGTPGYMSPEQAAGKGEEATDTRTDVYSLGVLLYELLVGVTPLDEYLEKASSLQELCRVIAEREPQRPARRIEANSRKYAEIAVCRATSVAGLSKQIESDLDWRSPEIRKTVTSPAPNFTMTSNVFWMASRLPRGLPASFTR